MPPGRGTPLHRHHREDQGFLILDGEYEIRLGDRVVRAKTGISSSRRDVLPTSIATLA
jgi:mannose-6-phosphate isomerase-like protein (cupin superfamily)